MPKQNFRRARERQQETARPDFDLQLAPEYLTCRSDFCSSAVRYAGYCSRTCLDRSVPLRSSPASRAPRPTDVAPVPLRSNPQPSGAYPKTTHPWRNQNKPPPEPVAPPAPALKPTLLTSRELRAKREYLGLSQNAMARALGMPRSTWTECENGRRASEKTRRTITDKLNTWLKSQNSRPTSTGAGISS